MAEAATLERTQYNLQNKDFLNWENEIAQQPEQRKSFDVLASVRMFRYDLQHFGQVLPETRERVVDEELSFMAEGVNRASRTEFVLQRRGTDLMYYKNGRWLSYSAMVEGGAQVARAEAAKDYRRKFLADSEADNVKHMLQMRMLKPGEQYVYYSAYSEREEQLYGRAFMESCGRFPDRKMGFLYRAYCNEAGNVILESQTVDGNSQPGFDAATQKNVEKPAATMDDLVAAYDATFTEDVYAGRPKTAIGENAWETILAQRDLIEFFIQKLEAIAIMSLPEGALEEATKRHMYGVWAAFKQRLNGVNLPTYQPLTVGLPATHLALLEREVQQAFTDFALEGRPMVGCGGKIEMLRGEKNILDTSPDNVFNAIFGENVVKSEDGKIPSIINCIACKRKSPKEKVVKKDTWCCPHCKYEIDVCTGKVLHESVQPKAKSRKLVLNSGGRTKGKPSKS